LRHGYPEAESFVGNRDVWLSLSGFENDSPARKSHQGRYCRAAFGRAVDAMHATVGRAWTVTELAAVAGVSSRTLQRQFPSLSRQDPARDASRHQFRPGEE
jgi:transcriptional regulator GlxA family with amidase domain